MRPLLLLLFLYCYYSTCTSQSNPPQVIFDYVSVIDDSFYTNNPSAVFSIDLDGDGDMDVISASTDDNRISWFENIDGLGTFSRLKIISNNSNGISVSSADIDNDGDNDVVSFEGNEIVWYENLNGLGSFSSKKIVFILNSDQHYLIEIKTRDIDNDGNIDVISSGEDGLAWFENDGFGNFTIHEIGNDNPLIRAFSFDVADIDNDGDLDLIGSSRSFFARTVYYENIDGLGNFSTENLIANHNPNNSIFNSFTDIDSDGFQDVVFSTYDSTGIVNLFWCRNIDGQGNFTSPQFITGNNNSVNYYFFTKDVDQDGFADIVKEESDEIIWIKNLNGTTFSNTPIIISSSIEGASCFFSSDLNNDNNLDLIIGQINRDNISWLNSLNGQGQYGTPKSLTYSKKEPFRLSTADIDGDGNLDILSTTLSGLDKSISIHKFDGANSSFDFPENLYTYQSSALSAILEDYDNDGDFDAVTSGDGGNLLSFINSDGQGNYNIQQIITGNSPIERKIFSEDINSDGLKDILSINLGDNTVEWFENLGSCFFDSPQIISNSYSNISDIYSNDMDNDGDNDIIVCSSTNNKISWFENIDGLGNFSPEKTISIDTNNPTSLKVNDIDGDELNDVIVASTNNILYFKNIAEQDSFAQPINIGDNQFNYSDVEASDLDNDGDIDIIASTLNTNQRLLWFENINESFSNSYVLYTDNNFFNPINIRDIESSDIDGDGNQDIIFSIPDEDKIVCFFNRGSRNKITGNIKFDINSSNCSDGQNLSNILVEAESNTTNYASFTDNVGNYNITSLEGTYSIEIQNIPLSHFNINPINHSAIFTDLGNEDINNDFCLQATTTIDDLNVTIIPPTDEPRPGFDTSYQIIYSNNGTTQLSGDITFQFDDSKIQFLNASETVASQTANSLTFDYANLNPFETRTIDLGFNVFPPPTTNIDEELVSSVSINPTSGDETQNDNTFTLEQTVIGSYDPNDIQILEGDQVHIDDSDEYLHFLIRFQNTGTASAINVRVEHILDNKLDWTTMQLQSLSHDGRVEITDGSDVQFIFNNINLPAQTTDEEGSIGYIAFKIKPLDNVVVGDIISGVADIYFDFNPPIITNTANTVFVENLGSDDFGQNEISIYPNPTGGLLNIQSNSTIENIQVFDMLGREVLLKQSNSNQIEIDLSTFQKGIYLLNIYSDNSVFTKKIIKN